jgi:hypothetical protein
MCQNTFRRESVTSNFPLVFTKLVSTPKKFIIPTLDLTQKIICAAQNKSKSVQKIDDSNDDKG